MIKYVIDYCLKNRLIVLLATALLVAYGWNCFQTIPVDAIPNVGENQVIVLTKWGGRSPKDIEDQITQPLSIALQSVPGSESVRGKSMFGFSFVQVTFADSIDLYWARSRVSEQLTSAGGLLPDGVKPEMAPDATALGQIFYYVLKAPPGMDLAELRTIQDYKVRYALRSVDGVAEVASIGGYVLQYQIEVDPNKLRIYDLMLSQVIQSVKNSNIDVGAKTLESGGVEYLIRGVGFIGAGKSRQETIKQIEQSVITTVDGIPVTIGDIASVEAGPAFRGGALDLNGSEAVGGVVVMRDGRNPREVIQNVKERIDSLEGGLDGVKIVGIYDRTELIDQTVSTLTEALSQEIVITIVVVVLFLLHIRASLVVATTLPVAVLMAFVAMKNFQVDANIMSLAGIAIAIGTMVDMGIIISENIFSGVAKWIKDGTPGGEKRRVEIIRDMTNEVAPAVVTAVSTTVISFLPVFYLTGRDFRLFSPLAWTKTFSLLASLIVAVVLVPLLARAFLKPNQNGPLKGFLAAIVFGTVAAILCTVVWNQQISELAQWLNIQSFALSSAISLSAAAVVWLMFHERIKPVEQNVVSIVIGAIYRPMLSLFLIYKKTFLTIPVVIFFLGISTWYGLPKILEPVEQAALSVGANLNGLPGYTDLKHRLLGLKSDTWIALDEGSWFYMPSLYPAASFSQAMATLQTQDAMIAKIPEVENVLGKIGRIDSALDPAPTGMIETYIMLRPKKFWRKGMTEKKIWDEINDLATLPGITLADDLQPIQGRVVMLQSGIKAKMAVRIYGDDLESLSKAAEVVSEKLKKNYLVNSKNVNPDVVMGKPYIEFEVDREESARYGMTVRAVNELVEAALGGKNATFTVENRRRSAIQVRYQRSFRDQLEQLEKLPIVTPTGAVVPLSRLAKMTTSWGPSVINSENARLVAHVNFGTSGAKGDIETAEEILKFVNKEVNQSENSKLTETYHMEVVGSYESQIEANNKLMIIIPVVLLINILIIYMQFHRIGLTLTVFAGIPVAFGGGMMALGVWDVDLNTAVWVGFIALFGIAIDDGVVIATYLDQTLKANPLNSISDIRKAVMEAGLRRIRPCLMTTCTTVIALIPVLISTGRGADVARAMAIPVFGGMIVELVTLFVVPVVYCGILEFKWNARIKDDRFGFTSQNS